MLQRCDAAAIEQSGGLGTFGPSNLGGADNGKGCLSSQDRVAQLMVQAQSITVVLEQTRDLQSRVCGTRLILLLLTLLH